MNTVLVLVVSCILAAQPANAHLANGIYVVLLSGEGTTVERSDGGSGKVVLGDLATTAFGKAILTSVSNDNSKYRLDMTGAGPFADGVEKHHYAVYVDCACVPAWGARPHADRTMDLELTIQGETAAEKIAKALGVKPVLRRHPGHQLVVSWYPVAESSMTGKPVVVRMEIKNVGEVPIKFIDGGHQRGPRNNQFGFTAYRIVGVGRAVPDTGSPENEGGPGSITRLPPGETFTKKVDITDWFKFDEPGPYKVTCLYRLELLEERARFPIWDEYAVGECLVRINDSVEKPKP